MESEVSIRKTFGNLHCYFFNKEEPLICIGPHWPFFVCLFTSLALLAVFFVFYACPNIGVFATLLGVVVFMFLLSSYLLAALVNPGIEMKKVKDDELEAEENDGYCGICDVYRAPRSEHCEECGVCIKEFDHHCPWTSKCVGKGNLRFFYAFLVGLLAAFVFGIVIMALQPMKVKYAE